MRDQIIQHIKENKIIVIVRGIYGIDREKLIEALWKGGIRLVEFTFDQKSPEKWEETCCNISETVARYGGKFLCGAGTVMTLEQLKMAKTAGANYIISPDMNPQVIQETVKLGMVSIPGAFSATEIAEAAKNGADYVKVFPAVSLGPEYLKALKGPLNYIPLMVVGGISYKNIDAYMEAGAAGAGIGGEIANKKWVESGEFEKITEAARLTIEKLHGGTHE